MNLNLHDILRVVLWPDALSCGDNVGCDGPSWFTYSTNLSRAFRHVLNLYQYGDCSIITGNIVFHFADREALLSFVDALEPVHHVAYRWRYAG